MTRYESRDGRLRLFGGDSHRLHPIIRGASGYPDLAAVLGERAGPPTREALIYCVLFVARWV